MRFAVALAILTLAIGPAEAKFSVCNKGLREAKVALGRFGGTHWISEGWFHIAPKKCALLIPGKLDARYYYLYATDGAQGTWDGGTNFCVGTADTFSIDGRASCVARGFDKRGFFQIDTGDRLDWSQNLSD
ncbi:MAG: DUF1036 domain-containing protein [Alphaproteobacteria bacterium]|nr:DUF1036 domain-containing protein [Alphaproteobacteria bacterium]MBL6936926.1 DUF1036 domain-containing protein [Alphaproteobacteria bacterium]MBL7097695.1 DUF1036 domain-containing protein [Alphaproteobacteria bacterium]